MVARGRRPPATDVDVEDAEFMEHNTALTDIGSPEANQEKADLERVIKEAIEDLPEDLRTAFTLREFSGLSYEEITEIMGCPVGTVRSRIFRAREALDKKIRPLLDNG
jgi:RNA polymerase sigma-70 factor (ECF subfamily)